MSSFSVFDWKYGLTKVDVVTGYTVQATGEWVSEVPTETSISGHVSDVSREELKYIDPALIEAGVRKLGVNRSVGLAAGDRIKVVEPDASTTEWILVTKQAYSGMLAKHTGIERETFLMRKRT